MSARVNLRVHLEYMHGRLLRLVGMMRRILRREWWLSRRARCVLYKSLFGNSVLYACSAWISVLEFKYDTVLSIKLY